jgi:hypothetical protein
MAATIEQEITPTGATLTESPEFQKAMESATTAEEIRAIIVEEAAKQNIVVPNQPTPPRDAEGRFVSPETKEEPKVETKDEEKFAYTDEFVIGGKKFTFEGDTPADINRQVKAAIAAHDNATNPPKKEEPAAAAPKKGVTAEQKVALELDYRMGKIGLDEYLEKAGALDSYLEKKGIKVDKLKEVVEERVSKGEKDAWETATDTFMKAEGQDWPGGDQNLRILGYKLEELGLKDKPSAESLQKAYDAMKVDGLVFQPAKAAAEVKTEPQPKKKLAGSSVFGLVGGAGRDRAPNTGAAKAPQITPDMSPREIMAIYKETAQANGLHPDDLLRESQRR